MFNERSRKQNIINTAIISGLSNIINVLLQFIYRTVFIFFLSKEYLGIEGLFTNIIQVLSLTEMGIGTVISYRLYSPIKMKDTRAIAALMNFYKKVYRSIAIIVGIIGTVLIPFLPYLIKDTSEVPSDINITFVYVLFLIQSISSYFFAYRQTLLAADQKYDKLSKYLLVSNVIKVCAQIIILAISHDYVSSLIVSIIINVISNVIIGIAVKRQYEEVFLYKDTISKEEKNTIIADTKSMMCHKVGGVILGSTDNLILSAFVGIGQLGIYSNYSLITGSVQKMMGQILGNFTSSIGNAHVSSDSEQKYDMYYKLLFLNLWIASVVTGCLFIVIKPFIIWWQGADMVFDIATTVVICICFHYNIARIINMTYINGCGLFNKDVIRPIIQSAINLVVSIVLVKLIGIPGVFIGTIISNVCTVFVREPFLLYKYEFKRSVIEYWKLFIGIFVNMLAVNSILYLLFSNWKTTFINILAEGGIAFIANNLILVFFYRKNQAYLYYKTIVIKKLRRNES